MASLRHVPQGCTQSLASSSCRQGVALSAGARSVFLERTGIRGVTHGRRRRRCRSARAILDVSAAQRLDPEIQNELKRAVARKAVERIRSNSVVAFGTGSTACIAIEETAKLIAEGKIQNVEVVVSCFQADIVAWQNKLKTTHMNNVNHIDLAIDGCDEVDLEKNLIKGGGSHTLEKVVNTLASETLIVVDQTKVVPKLGLQFPVPVEVLQPAVFPVLRSLANLGGVPDIRAALMKDGPIITDLGNMLLDVRFAGGVDDPRALEAAINNIPGTVENGLFCNCVQEVLVATNEGGRIEVLELAEYIKRAS